MSHQREILATHPKAIVSQGENAAITYTLNWIPRLDGDTIASSTWSSEDSGVTIANEANTTVKASARLSASPGKYLLTNKITLTTSGDTFEQQFQLRVKDNQSGAGNDYCGCSSRNW